MNNLLKKLELIHAKRKQKKKKHFLSISQIWFSGSKLKMSWLKHGIKHLIRARLNRSLNWGYRWDTYPSIEVESCRTRRGAVLPISNFRSWGTIPMINPRIYTRKHSSILGLRSLCRTVLHKHQTSNIITQMIFFSCDRAHVFKMNRSFHLHFSRSYTSHNAMGPLLMHVEEAKPDASVTGQNDLYSRRIIQSTTSTYIYVAQNGPQIKEISWWTHRKIYP